MAAKEKIRIDQLLLQQGLVSSRKRAQALVLAGKVIANEQRVEKPSQKFSPDEVVLRVKEKDHPYVSRGGVKLAGALQGFSLDPKEMVCLDVGASTGGFTDCLLKMGAKRVYTLDCGTNQLDYRLRQDPKVHGRENFNIRNLKTQDIPESLDLIVVDVSFISLKLVVPVLIKEMPGPWELILLIKPQFEAGRGQVNKGGIVRDESLQKEIVDNMINFVKKSGLKFRGVLPSVLKGEKGNQEFFLWARRNSKALPSI